ncbi:META domain-containing protein [uncultured Roseobacter sp.]|uniref:META domain-containing protein n=1 Tax=uncultured Roseobacter sp. TaxID=114847 RepID=UPI002637585F|nr:META domain-containing protein [uncultured Roseobacter sp.]
MTRVCRLGLACLVALLALSACRGDETVTAYGAADKIWRLIEIDGASAPFEATLRFPGAGQIAGDAPCNSYSGAMTVPYPWFDAQEIVATQLACPDIDAETTYLAALTEMTLSEVLGDTLILSTAEGRKMVFKADG